MKVNNEVVNETRDTISFLLENRREKIEKMLNETKKRLKMAPKGALRISHSNNCAQYYYKENKSDRAGKYLRKNQINLAKALAQKEYDQKVLNELLKEQKVIEDFTKKYNPDRVKNIYQNMSRDRQLLVTPIILTDKDYVDNWRKMSYVSKGFRENDMEFYSDAGERVRSKSEVIIANKLLQMGIPYHYECPITLISGRIVYPDFYCLNVRTRKTFIYEHFGRMDDPEYADKAVKKLAEYQENGYWIGKNLIASFETSKKVMNTRELEEILRQYLI